MKTAIIHIGGHKTGSTTIQTALGRSKRQLLSQKICYFNAYDRSKQLLSKSLLNLDRKGPVPTSNYLKSEHLRRASYAAWIKLYRQVQYDGHPFTVISEEFFFRLQNLNRMKRLLERIFDRIVIVAYVRDPLSKFPSGIDQRVRGGAPLNKLASGRAGIPLILPKLENYANIFGRKNLIVRNFDKANLDGGTPSSDFGHVLSQITGQPVHLDEVGRMNESLPADVTAFLFKMNNEKVVSDPSLGVILQNRPALVKLIRQDKHLMVGPKLYLNDEPLTLHLRAVFHKDVAAINDIYLAGQIKMEIEPSDQILSKLEFRQRLSDWVLSFEAPSKTKKMVKFMAQLENKSEFNDFVGLQTH